MDSFEWNKIIGAVLATLLFLIAIGIAADNLFEVEPPETKGYKVEGVEEAPAEPVVAKVEQGPDLASLLAEASPEKGARVYGRCVTCHAIEEGKPHGIGPNLYGIVGAPVGSREGFSYSDSLEAYEGDWDFALLDAYIEDPAAAIPGNRMPFSGIDRANQRADLLAFLRLRAANPVPLPEPEAGAEPEVAGAQTDPEAETSGEAVEETPEPPPAASQTGEAGTAPGPAVESPAESPLDSVLAEASAERGKKAFAACAICHNAARGAGHKVGPNLYGVVGAEVGRHDDFSYSQALAEYDAVWSYALLDRFLTSPSQAIPGNRMPFGGIKSPDERADLILYLESLAAALPEQP